MNETEHREEGAAPIKAQRPASSEYPTCESLRSDKSMSHPIVFTTETPAPGTSAMSMKTEKSIGRSINFEQDPQSASFEHPSCEALRSDKSMGHPIAFTTETVEQQHPDVSSDQQLDSIFKVHFTDSYFSNCHDLELWLTFIIV
ncbi:hypothetical protein NL108_015156 [Boleophthalmus pectinirostris]|nr:hypothetical protein NL108_015156 [Boleophthalmus pectinirostris]